MGAYNDVLEEYNIIWQLPPTNHYDTLRGYVGILFVVSNVRNPGSIKLRDRLLISKLFFVLQNPR
jgi:hypothetical protein